MKKILHLLRSPCTGRGIARSPYALFLAVFLVSWPVSSCTVRPEQGTEPKEAGAPEKPFLSPRVLLLIFDPLIPAEGKKRLSKACGWNDSEELAREYCKDVEEVSFGYVRYKLVEGIYVNTFPVKGDGFQYTPETYLECLRRGKEWHDPDGVDYEAIIQKYNLVWKVESGDIDEVWMFGGPYFGFYESIMVGSRAYFCNAPPLQGVACSRTFVIMGFNYERGVGEMLEDLGHRAESILTHVFGGWVAGEERHDWERFTLYDKVAPGRAACGNVHFAPNSESDYDWGNTREVWSTCDDWLHYPQLTGGKRRVDCTEWGGGDIREHHRWWFRHIPRASGKTGGKQNNWWKYIIDFNSYPESR